MQNLSKTNKKLIAAAIIQQNGKILIAQRSDKILEEECLKRELQEELSIHAEVGEHFCISTFNHKGTLYEVILPYNQSNKYI